ncbi:MAG: hypothetical protein KKI13_02565 [Candidatus Omnitrophica bacterium]|nr:hypothetical protein [Candidatus Omnitrophota bacterium]
MFNDSNFLLYGIDGSRKINISIDGKGVGQLSIGQYVVVETNEGKHMIHLTHKDIADFNSDHVIDIKEPESYLKIYSKTTSNGADLVNKPGAFEAEFRHAY